MEWHGTDLLRSLGVSGDRIRERRPWVGVVPFRSRDLPTHGWKIHISSRSATFPELLRIVVGELDREDAAYKIAFDSVTLAEINDGALGGALVGKAVTVYPSSERHFKDVVTVLSSQLRGWEGPRIRSDKQLVRDSPIYYRYGPFRQEWEVDDSGSTQLIMTGPAGEKEAGAATTRFEIPEWAADPFSSDRERSSSDIFAGRYRVVRGIMSSPRGDVVVVETIDTREQLILKQARAFVSETEDAWPGR